MLKDNNAVTPVRLEPAALRSRVKHSTTGNQIKSWCPYDGLRFAVKKQNNVEKYKKFDALAINCQVCGMFYVGYIKT